MKSLFAPLAFLESVESYKDGRAVPEWDWPGETAEAYPVYDGALVLSPTPLDELTKGSLVIGTGFSRLQELTPDELEERAGFSIRPSWSALLLSTLKRPTDDRSIRNVERKLRGKSVWIMPYVAPLTVEVRR